MERKKKLGGRLPGANKKIERGVELFDNDIGLQSSVSMTAAAARNPLSCSLPSAPTYIFFVFMLFESLDSAAGMRGGIGYRIACVLPMTHTSQRLSSIWPALYGEARIYTDKCADRSCKIGSIESERTEKGEHGGTEWEIDELPVITVSGCTGRANANYRGQSCSRQWRSPLYRSFPAFAFSRYSSSQSRPSNRDRIPAPTSLRAAHQTLALRLP